MRLLNIASGSSGNATYIGSEKTHLLVDAGISRKRILCGLQEADISLADLDAILITHEHVDHIAALGILERTREIPVYATAGTIAEIKRFRSLGDFNYDVLHPISADEAFYIRDLQIKPLRIDHDAKEPVCYRIEQGEKSCAIVTDLGNYNEYLLDNLQGLDLLMLESNHDVRMLEAGKYPYPLKQRILGEYGHLSNENSGAFLNGLLHDGIGHILLSHISRENNTRELAKMAVENEVNAAETPYRAGDFDITPLRHDAASALYFA